MERTDGEPDLDAARELHDLLEAVHDRASFLAFVEALIGDREQSVVEERVNPNLHPFLCPDAGGRYNTSIEGYLEAAAAWAEADPGRPERWFPEEPSWKAFATFLYAGKIYE